MASQRPRKNNSPGNSKLKPQPLKATAPLSSLIRNPSPTRRRQSPPVPSPVLVGDTKCKIRRSPDVFSSEHRTLVSPLGDKPKPVRMGPGRTNSLETLSSSYMNGQWPRDIASATGPTMCSKETQTQFVGWDDSSEETQKSQHKRSNSLGSADTKEKFKQYLQRTKQSQPIHGRQSPLQGDHSAVAAQTGLAGAVMHSRAIPIPSTPKAQNLHTRRSVEGLNSEIEILVHELGILDNDKLEKTPEGRKAPLAAILSRNVDTQTSNGVIDPSELYTSNIIANTSAPNSRSQSTSPSWPIVPCGIPESPRPSSGSSSNGAVNQDNASPETTTSAAAKFSSSPNFLFARGPPDGAEKVPSHVENADLKESDPAHDGTALCPDKSKVKILFSKNSPFNPLQSIPQMAVAMASCTSSATGMITQTTN
eukprot:gene3676-4193_t